MHAAKKSLGMRRWVRSELTAHARSSIDVTDHVQLCYKSTDFSYTCEIRGRFTSEQRAGDLSSLSWLWGKSPDPAVESAGCERYSPAACRMAEKSARAEPGGRLGVLSNHSNVNGSGPASMSC